MPSTAGRTSEETSFSLVWDENFGSGTFTENTQVSPSRASSPERLTFSFVAMPLEESGVVIDDAGQRAPKTAQMRAAILLGNVVGEGQDGLVITVIPPQRGFDRNAVFFAAHR